MHAGPSENKLCYSLNAVRASNVSLEKRFCKTCQLLADGQLIMCLQKLISGFSHVGFKGIRAPANVNRVHLDIFIN